MKAMEGWERKSFKELGVCIRGVSYKPDDLCLAPDKNNVTLLRSNNIRDGRLNFHNLQFVVQSVVRTHQRMQNDDIAICMSNGNRALVGKSGQFLKCGDGNQYTVGAFCSIFRPYDEFDASFIRYLFGSDQYKRQLDGILAGSAINNLKGSDIDGLIACVPTSKPEQIKIAEVLSTVDRVIEQTEALIAKQQRIKTGLMQDLLTRGIDEHGNLRSEETHQFKDSPLGRIPVEWEVQPCIALCREIVVGIVIRPTQYYQPDGVPVLRSHNVKENKVTMKDLVFMSEKDNQALSKSCVRTGDLVTVRTGYPGTTSVIPTELDGSNCVDIVISRPSREKVRSEFLSMWVNSDYGKRQVLECQGGLAQQHFNVREMRSLMVKTPDIDEQARIENYLMLQNLAIIDLINKLNKHRSLKTALMQDLLTGKKRVTPLLNEMEASI